MPIEKHAFSAQRTRAAILKLPRVAQAERRSRYTIHHRASKAQEALVALLGAGIYRLLRHPYEEVRRAMPRKYLAVSVVVAMLGGCSSIDTIDDFPWPGHPRSQRVQGERVDLRMISTADAHDMSLFPTGANVNFPAECGQPERVAPLLGGALGAALATAAIGYVADAVNTRLAEEAKKYEATWTAVRSGHFYADQRGTLAARCFRLTRSASGADPAFDFVGQFDVSAQDAAGVRVRPLYLRYEATKARTGNSGRFSATMVVTVEAVWIERRQSGLARTARAFSAVLPFGQHSLDGNPIIINGPSSWSESTWLPAVPYSLDARGNPIGRGAYTLSATVAETATARDQAGEILGLARSGVERARQAALDALSN